MLALIPSATLLGVDGRPVSVEVHVSVGLPGFTVVGLPDTACREARDRVRAALLSSSLPWPLKKVTVNLAPSGLRKSGAALDVAIAVGLLVAAGELPGDVIRDCAFLGELSLDGTIRGVPGVLSLVDAVSVGTVVVPPMCAAEAGLLGRHTVRVASTLTELVAALRGEAPWPSPPEPPPLAPLAPGPDLADVRGQGVARLAIEVAAAGGHHMLMVGPPGAGKTMLARRLPGILPELSTLQALETTRVHSAAGLDLPPSGLVRRAPLRAPHHSASSISLIGGGTSVMRPGEISMATNGVLLLDELGEFPASVLDALRQPLEEGVVRLSRARGTATYPAHFLLVGAMNPCPCGLGGAPGFCRCSDAARARYGRRLSAPLLDRFDLRVEVTRPDPRDLLAGPGGESSATVAERVVEARLRASDRGVAVNAAIPSSRLDELAPLSGSAAILLEQGLRSGALTGRGLHRVRRVARTLADLGGRPGSLGDEDVCLALQLRAETDLLGAAA